MTRNPLDSVKHTILETPDPERSLHLAADILPALAADLRMYAAVGDDLDATVGKQQVNEHAVIVFSIPDSQRRKHFDGALARRLITEQGMEIKRVFHRKPDLPGAVRLRFGNGMLDSQQCTPWQQLAGPPVRHHQVTQHPREFHFTSAPKHRRRQTRRRRR